MDTNVFDIIYGVGHKVLHFNELRFFVLWSHL